MSTHDSTFRAMGSEVRLIVEGPACDGRDPAAAAAETIAFIAEFERRLSRFRPTSELSRLNADPRATVPASPLMLDALDAAREVAELTGGLVDPTLVDEIEAAGYRHSREGAVAARLQDALALAPGRKPAGPSPTRRWELIEVDHEAGVVHRPPGVRIDSGGFGKGFAADLAVEGLSGFNRCVVGCGGDLRVGGASADPFEVLVEHPLTGERDQKIVVGSGGVATSGLNARVWKREDGGFAHHLIDPSTGRPAWTGLVGVTALAPTAVEAEARSKAALLAGPGGGAEILRRHGGLIVHEDGEIEPIGPIRLQPNRRVVIPMNAVAA